MLTTPLIFERYQKIKERIPPSVSSTDSIQDISSLSDIAEGVSAFVFDAFGVLNVGDTLINGADARLQQLRARGCHIRILTNAASYDHAGTVEKFHRLGLNINSEEIVTSRQAATANLDGLNWGVIAAPDDKLGDITTPHTRLGDDTEQYAEVEGFLFLSSTGWTDERQYILVDALLQRPRPVIIANPDLVAPRDHGFSLEPGHFGHLLMDAGFKTVRFFGKPFPEVYELIEASLPDIAADKIVMCGDSLHTDIIGAAARGWKTVLVTQDGLFAGFETSDYCEKAGLYPNWRLPRI